METIQEASFIAVGVDVTLQSYPTGRSLNACVWIYVCIRMYLVFVLEEEKFFLSF